MTKHFGDGGKEKLIGRNLQENQVELRQYWQVQPDPDKPFYIQICWLSCCGIIHVGLLRVRLM